jgi:type II secretory pathway component PulF
MTDNQPEPTGFGCLGALVLFGIGVVMLLPGLCAVLFGSSTPIPSNSRGLIFWGLFVAALGVLLIALAILGLIARRRARGR